MFVNKLYVTMMLYSRLHCVSCLQSWVGFIAVLSPAQICQDLFKIYRHFPDIIKLQSALYILFLSSCWSMINGLNSGDGFLWSFLYLYFSFYYIAYQRIRGFAFMRYINPRLIA